MFKESIPTKIIILADILLLGVLILFFLQIINTGKNYSKSELINPQAEAIAQKIARSCINRQDAEKCYIKEFATVTEDKGIIFAQQTLYAIQDFDSQLRHCHVISHEISKIAVRQNPSDWKNLIDKVNVGMCGGGFFHGILEAHTGDDPDFKINTDFINKTCNTSKNDFKERTCAHILGHILLVQTEGQIEPALPICAPLEKTFAQECYMGIFMEDSFKLALADHGLAQIPQRDEKRMNAQEKRCFKYEGTAGVACWIDMAEIFVEFYNNDPEKAYESCNRAPFEDARRECYLKAAVLMGISPSFDTKAQLLSACAPYIQEENTYKLCTHLVVSGLMYYSPKFIDRGNILCSNIDTKYKEYCFKELGDLLKMNVSQRAEREQFCSNTPDEYKSFCVN